MNPWNLLGKTATPGGDEMVLMHRPGEHLILAGGKPLMSSRMHGSEEAMAEMACRHAHAREAPTVLVGGLGMGFTLRATLNLLPADATVVVAELVAGVVEWNRGPLGHLADHPLKDQRVQVEVTPVDQLLRATKGRFDVVLLDVDNGPGHLVHQANAALYGPGLLAVTRRALRPGGLCVVWSAARDEALHEAMREVFGEAQASAYDVDLQGRAEQYWLHWARVLSET
jgi:spermidine synthase